MPERAQIASVNSFHQAGHVWGLRPNGRGWTTVATSENPGKDTTAWIDQRARVAMSAASRKATMVL
jgi:hypothetical protein